MRKILLYLLISAFPLLAFAEEDNNNKFKVVPNGRLLIDGALYASPEKHLFKDGLAIPEVRLGAKLNYGKWSSWIDVGFAYGKIGLRNMWIQYDFDSHNSLRAGNFLQPFGYQSISTANNKPTFEQPLVSAVFTPGLQLGVMYTYVNPAFYSSSAFHVESSALTNVMNYPLFNQQGYSLLTRFVWRLKDSGSFSKPILQAGISFGFSSPERHLVDDNDIHEGFYNSANFPTKVSSVTAVSATVGNARNRFKLSPEFVVAYKKIAFESQYFFQTIARKNNLCNYNSQGGYATLRTVLFGQDYGYDSALAQIANPKKNTLEFVADYNYVTLSDAKARIFGGRANSFNFTLNYYFNPYFTARLNYSFTHVWDREDEIPLTQNAFQLRLMVLF